MYKRQILVIHGGGTFSTYEEYISFIKDSPINLERLRSRGDWKDTLQERLGGSYDVFQPKMPNGTNAQYEEWKLFFDKIIKLLENKLVLIGHSLGGIFLAKYLSENYLNKKIVGIFLIAPPFNDVEMGESVGSFGLQPSLEKLVTQSENIFLYQSTDDKVVPFSNGEKYKEHIPHAFFKTFSDRGHFKQEEFPELIEDIRLLW